MYILPSVLFSPMLDSSPVNIYHIFSPLLQLNSRLYRPHPCSVCSHCTFRPVTLLRFKNAFRNLYCHPKIH